MVGLSLARDKRVIVGLLAVLVVVGGVAAAPKALAGVKTPDLLKNNIFALIDQMSGTTDGLLANTGALHQQIQQVEGQLGELGQQDQIVSQQLQTTQQLQQALSTQEDLTRNGVSLMQQIMSREEVSVSLTHQVATQAQQMSGAVQGNVQALNHVLSSLAASNTASEQMNSKMDQLLAELSDAEDNFKVFGQLNSILNSLHLQLPKLPSVNLPKLPILGGSGSSGGSSSSSGSGGTSSGNTTGSGGASSGGVLGTIGNAVGSLLGW